MTDETDSESTDTSAGNPVRISSGPGVYERESGDGDGDTRQSLVKAQESQQLDEGDFSTDEIPIIEPPFDPDDLSQLLQIDETHAAAVTKKARYTAGFGFDLAEHEHADDTDTDTDTGTDGDDEEPPGKDTVTEFWFGDDSSFQIGPDSGEVATPTEVLERAWLDLESIGWYALELLVGMDGKPTGLAHIPAKTIRKREDGNGFVQLGEGLDKTYYGRAGMRYDTSDTGEESNQRFVDKDTGDVGESAGDVGTVANELIVGHNPSLKSLHYGTPDVIPALKTIEGDLAAKHYNVDFFDNNAVPRFAVMVEGATVNDALRSNIEGAFQDLRGTGNNSRTLVIDPDPAPSTGLDDGPDVNIQLEPLTVGVEEDASFLEYRTQNEHKILQVHDVPPIIAGITQSANRANSKEQRQTFIEEAIRPKQGSFAARLYETIHKTALGVSGWTIEFNVKGARNEQDEADVVKKRSDASNGMLTVNELREELSKDPLLDDEGNPSPVGNMLVAEIVGDSSPASTDSDPSEIVDENALEQLVDDELAERVAEEHGYDIAGRPDLSTDGTEADAD